MHGVVILDEAGEAISPLVTWQDGRCLEGGFLGELSARLDRDFGVVLYLAPDVLDRHAAAV
jgi:hypothetical protein